MIIDLPSLGYITRKMPTNIGKHFRVKKVIPPRKAWRNVILNYFLSPSLAIKAR